ncbi:MAG: TIGR04282 family arsenosugar biosynthesis glycosyltransferase [Opitutaceae bacterium]
MNEPDQSAAHGQRSANVLEATKLDGRELQAPRVAPAGRSPVILAMLKAPRVGFVKTRLALEIGAEPAAAIYRRLVEHQMSAIPRDWPVEVHFSPAEAAAEMQQWLGARHAYYPQSGDDLGERLDRSDGVMS